ncbi:hypothetical protein BC751_3691 [Cecembia calidifontis]|uniref:Uncharacterized protein n=2 Tax=Cecembia calidifontis TaxID=1187080 RepID=A0A4V2F6Z7_9BACT|nr:hypothetical protein BC751_3691 [Cecembia calidifontis]
MLVRLKRSILSRLVIFTLLFNFINLTANFYHASVMDSTLLPHHDPIDSLAELVLEFVLDMDEETIPDTDIPHEKKKISDIKLNLPSKISTCLKKNNYSLSAYSEYYSKLFKSLEMDVNAPPPRLIQIL